MSSPTFRFVDEYSNVHECGTVLGSGGQGVVYRTKDPDVALKIALDGNGRPVAHTSYVEKLRRVRALPVPAGLNLATPKAVLQDRAGYAMRLLRDMEPFTTFWPPPPPKTEGPEWPTWLAAVPGELAWELQSYRDSGGLRRRLIGLYKCASILARIHGAGLVYGDVSPSNVFIATTHGAREVWLIDADNLRYETAGGGPGIYTPQFGAPELVQQRSGACQRTDCHAFAVMAFSLLTLLHPFIGALVEAGGEGDWANNDADNADMDQRAYAGHLPWILDEDDASNHKDNGLIDLTLTSELLALFQATFGPGRTRAWMRPSMFCWPEALARAVDATVTCAGCGMSHFIVFEDFAQPCPFCAEVGAGILVATAFAWLGQPVASQKPAWRLVQSWGPGQTVSSLAHRLFYPFSVQDGDRDVLFLNWEEDELRLTIRDAGRRHRFALATAEDAADGFFRFEGTAALPMDQLRVGFWLRVEGACPRLVHLQFRQGQA